jgi:hypothetical protein
MAMTRFVISYRAAENYVPDNSAWVPWLKLMQPSLADIGNPIRVREVTQLGECGASQQLRGYSVVTADDMESALALAKGCPGLADRGFGIEVGLVEEVG